MTPYTWRNFAISSPPAREGQLDRLFLHKELFVYKLSVKRQKTAQKTGNNPIKTCFFHACLKITEMRDPSKWKFPNRGIPQNRNFQNEGSLKMEISKTRESIHFCSFLQEISSFYKCFSVLNWDSQFQNFIEEFQCLQCMSNIGLLITFHTATSGAICWPSSQAIPRFGNFYFEGSLVLEISILRDPSFWKFPF